MCKCKCGCVYFILFSVIELVIEFYKECVSVLNRDTTKRIDVKSESWCGYFFGRVLNLVTKSSFAMIYDRKCLF